MPETIFSKIIRGQIPCHKVYEDDKVLAFIDIGPLSRGHTLLIPKEEKATIDALSDDSAAALGRALPRLCRAVMKATGATAYNVLQNNGAAANQTVPHVHFHIIPRYADARGAKKGSGLDFRWTPGTLAPDEAATLAEAIRAAL
jgi:histidine triad (HIT) family protein